MNHEPEGSGSSDEASRPGSQDIPGRDEKNHPYFNVVIQRSIQNVKTYTDGNLTEEKTKELAHKIAMATLRRINAETCSNVFRALQIVNQITDEHYGGLEISENATPQ